MRTPAHFRTHMGDGWDSGRTRSAATTGGVMTESPNNPESSSNPVPPKPGDTGAYGYQYPTQQQPQSQPYPGQYGPPPLPPSNAGWAVAAILFFWPLAF